jgi:hypothetical protein
MPSRLDSPCVGRSPTRLLCAAGMRIEPQGLRVWSYGLRVRPPSELMLVMPDAYSCRLVFATMIAPAARSRATRSTSAGRTCRSCP